MTILELLDQAGDRDPLGRGSGIDFEAAANAAGDLLVALEADLDAPGLKHTLRRMAAAYAEMLFLSSPS